MSNIVLADSGSMDTLLVCEDCKEEFRYNFDPMSIECDTCEGQAEVCPSHYEDFIDWAIEDATNDHECRRSDQ